MVRSNFHYFKSIIYIGNSPVICRCQENIIVDNVRHFSNFFKYIRLYMPKVGVNKYMSTIMTDWGSIQSRSVDPYANVDSDVANAQHIRMGNSRMFYTGLALESFEVDSSNNLLLGTFSAGTVVMDNVSIEFTSSFTIALVSFPNLVSTTKDIVVYYHYEKTKPAPVASIKIIDDTNYDSSTQLKLYTYITGSWSSVIDLDTWQAWIDGDGVWTDQRFKTGPLFRNNDTTGTCILCPVSPTEDYHLTNKSYVDTLVDKRVNPNSVINVTGGTISGPITWDSDRTPLSSKELVTKGYTDSTYLRLAGGTVTGQTTFTGNLLVPTQPATAGCAVNQEYINEVLGTLDDEGALARYLKKVGGDMSGPINMPTNVITDATHLVNKEFVENNYLKLSGGTVTGPIHSNSIYVSSNDCLINKNYADSTYLAVGGGTLLGVISYNTTITISDDSNLINKGYADKRYIQSGQTTAVSSFLITTSTITNSTSAINKEYADNRYVLQSNNSYWTNTNSPVTLSDNGSVALNNGFQMKWGKVTIASMSSDTWNTINFGSAFTTGCYNVTATLSTVSNGTEVLGLNIAVKNFTTTSFDLYTGYFEGGSCVVYYQAIGH